MTYDFITDNIIKQAKAMIQDFSSILDSDDKKIIGCSIEEIDKLEKSLPSGYKLPKAYKEFLAFAGKKIVRVYNLSDFSYDRVMFMRKTNYEDIIYTLEVNDEDFAELPKNIFIITEHLGEYIMYFKLDDGENPPVYYWKENVGGLDTAVKEYQTITNFLETMIQSSRKLLQ